MSRVHQSGTARMDKTVGIMVRRWTDKASQLVGFLFTRIPNWHYLLEYSTLKDVFPDNIGLSCKVGECANEQDYLDVQPIVRYNLFLPNGHLTLFH
jgi:hypothetical protein